MRWFMPKEEKFFEILAELSANALEGSKELKELIDKYPGLERDERKSRADSINKIKRKSDITYYSMLKKLNKSPRISDKNEIYQIAVLLDDIMGLIDSAASHLIILSIERIDDYIIKLSDIALNAVSELNNCTSNFRKLRDIEESCAKIYRLENEADKVNYDALSDLFHFYKNSIDIIKYKELYDLFETLIDKCADTANVIENMIDKHS